MDDKCLAIRLSGYLIGLWVLLCPQLSSAQLLITEIMADPTPSRGLPSEEYVEIFNASGSAISLKNYRFVYGGQEVAFPDSSLAAGQYAIVVRRGNEALFREFGKVIALARLSLLNAGTLVQLQSGGVVVHEVNYSDNWYTSERAGGYSLEMIDLRYPCVEAPNWTSSTDPRGGSPGRANAAARPNPDTSPPNFLVANVIAERQVSLVFSEKLAVKDYTKLLKPAAPVGTITSAVVSGQGREIILTFREPLPDAPFTITLEGVADCSGNEAAKRDVIIRRPYTMAPGDLLLSEILVNPKPNGVDFVEIYNASAHYLSIQDILLATRDNDGELKSVKKPVTSGVLPPGQYAVLVPSKEVHLAFFPQTPDSVLVIMDGFPAFANEKGTVVLLDKHQKPLDELPYTATMHQPQLREVEGVSLERISWIKPTNDPANWHSSAATAGFATPGLPNSAAPLVTEPEGALRFSESVISAMTPETTLLISLPENGLIGSLQLVDIQGRKVYTFFQNQTLGRNGQFTWRGLDTNGHALPVGYYVAILTTFNLAGKQTTHYAKVVVGER